MNGNQKNYDDIINLPHHVSPTHPQMSLSDRAAQFAPFAALTAHGEAIKETARLTDARIELDEDEKTVLNERLRMVQETLQEQPEITLTYFQPDGRKAGGRYVTATGKVKKFDTYGRVVVMYDGLRIPFREIYKIEGELFGFADDQSC